eukprot:sb/3474710/
MILQFSNRPVFTHHNFDPTETSKQSIRTRYLGHMTGYQPIRGQYFLISSFYLCGWRCCLLSLNIPTSETLYQLGCEFGSVNGRRRSILSSYYYRRSILSCRGDIERDRERERERERERNQMRVPLSVTTSRACE